MSPTYRWCVWWHDRAMWDGERPLLFYTRREARQYINSRYGYIRTRADLRAPPFSWRMPQARRIIVNLTPCDAP